MMLSLTVVALVVNAAGDVTLGAPETRSARLLDGALAQYAPAYPAPPAGPPGPVSVSNSSARLAELNAREAAIRAQPMPSAGGAVIGIVIGSILLASAIPFAIWAVGEWIAAGVGFYLLGAVVLAIVPTVLLVAALAVGVALVVGGLRGIATASEARRRQNELLDQIQRERQLIVGGQSVAPRSTEWAPLVTLAL